MHCEVKEINWIAITDENVEYVTWKLLSIPKSIEAEPECISIALH